MWSWDGTNMGANVAENHENYFYNLKEKGINDLLWHSLIITRSTNFINTIKNFLLKNRTLLLHQPDTSTPGKEIKPGRKSGLINCILLFGGGGVIKYIWEASAVPAVNTAIYIQNGGSEEVWRKYMKCIIYLLRYRHKNAKKSVYHDENMSQT